MYTILVCDDERDIVNALKIYLTADGYRVLTAYDGREALDLVKTESVNLILLDIMMPVMNGIDMLSELRLEYNIPVILITAKSEDADKIMGLDCGADDYVTKPFNPAEVKARVRSQLRRYMQLGAVPETPPEHKDEYLVVGGIRLDDKTRTVTLDGDIVTLTPTQYEILKYFMQNPDRVLTPKQIYRNVWGSEPYGAEGTVAVHIRHLREKLEIDPSHPRYFRVVWGEGYRLMSNVNGKIKESE